MYLRKKKILIVSLLVSTVVLIIAAISIFFIIREFYWEEPEDPEICIKTDCMRQSELFRGSVSSYICSPEECVITSSNISDITDPTCISMECVTRGDKDKYRKINSKTVCLDTMCFTASFVTHLKAGGNCSTSDCIVLGRPGESWNLLFLTVDQPFPATLQQLNHVAGEVLKLMDKNVKPCDDFYEFSCHGSSKNTPPDEQKTYNIVKAQNETLSAPIRLNDSDSLKKIKTVYQTCVKESSTEIIDVTDLSDVLRRAHIGSWPLLETKNINRNCRSEMELRTAMLHVYGVETFFRLEVDFSEADSTAFIKMTVAPPLFEGICSEGNEDSRRMNRKYTDMLNKIFSHLLKDESRAKRATEGIKEFDRAFCNATKKNMTSEEEPSRITLEELAKRSPKFNWKLWHSIISSEFNIDSRLKNAPIYVYDVQLYIDNIILLVNRTSSAWINYLSMKFMLSYMSFLDRPLREIMMEYSSAFQDYTAYALHPVNLMPRWEQCQKYLQKVMGIALIPSFVNDLIKVNVKREMEYLGELVKHSFKETFHHSQVLYEQEKKQIMKTISRFGVFLIYPEENSTFYDEYFESMGPFGDTFLETAMQVRLFHQKKIFEAVYRGACNYDLELQVLLRNPFESQAFAAVTDNKTVIFIGGMHVAGVKPDIPRYMNFATLGTTIAQEYVIGSHLLSVEPGNDTFDFKEKEWRPWPEYIRHHVAEKRQCYEDKYSTQTQENGNLDVQEMMANVQALKESLQAYRLYCEKYGHEPLLQIPHLKEKRVDDQLFFILYAQAFCSKHLSHQPDYDESLMPGAKRVNEVLRNLEDFADTFHCASDSPMNPSDRCGTVW